MPLVWGEGMHELHFHTGVGLVQFSCNFTLSLVEYALVSEDQKIRSSNSRHCMVGYAPGASEVHRLLLMEDLYLTSFCLSHSDHCVLCYLQTTFVVTAYVTNVCGIVN